MVHAASALSLGALASVAQPLSAVPLCLPADAAHGPMCRCSPPRRQFISGVEGSGAPPGGWGSASYADYNDATDAVEPYDAHAGARAPPRPYGLGLGPAAVVADDECDFDEDIGQHPAPENLSEEQIQRLIQQQVARLNARLNELDEELAAEEEEIETHEEQQERQLQLKQKQAREEREKMAAASGRSRGGSRRHSFSIAPPSAAAATTATTTGAALSHRALAAHTHAHANGSATTTATTATAATDTAPGAADHEPDSPLESLDIDLSEHDDDQ